MLTLWKSESDAAFGLDAFESQASFMWGLLGHWVTSSWLSVFATFGLRWAVPGRLYLSRTLVAAKDSDIGILALRGRNGSGSKQGRGGGGGGGGINAWSGCGCEWGLGLPGYHRSIVRRLESLVFAGYLGLKL